MLWRVERHDCNGNFYEVIVNAMNATLALFKSDDLDPEGVATDYVEPYLGQYGELREGAVLGYRRDQNSSPAITAREAAEIGDLTHEGD